ncbi:MAG: EF-hand domain-containing protein [Thiobacillus sp.]|nr:EF-hand domain-containing protein [Thiobacillus sp.]
MKFIHPNFLTLTLAGLLSAASASVLAQSTPGTSFSPAPSAPSFRIVDSNGDGKISLEEFKALGGNEQTFAEIDANQDKSLSKDEFAKLG